MPDLSFGPPRYFVPISIRYDYGFYGGPCGYEERTEMAEGMEPITIVAEQRVVRKDVRQPL